MTRSIACLSFVFFTLSCQLFQSDEKPIPQTEREVLFEKGQALIQKEQFAKAEPIFKNLVSSPESESDSVYNPSLWYMSLVYEKMGSPEKAILTLNQLLNRTFDPVSVFKIKAALMKNYFRIDNKVDALRLKNELTRLNPKDRMDADALYSQVLQTLNFNYDHLAVEEIEYLTEIQKYLLFVMEQKESSVNQKATEKLTAIYQRFYDLSQKNTLAKSFKEKILIATFDGLRKFEVLKLADLSMNSNAVNKFSQFSEKIQKQITEWLHQ